MLLLIWQPLWSFLFHMERFIFWSSRTQLVFNSSLLSRLSGIKFVISSNKYSKDRFFSPKTRFGNIDTSWVCYTEKPSILSKIFGNNWLPISLFTWRHWTQNIATSSLQSTRNLLPDGNYKRNEYKLSAQWFLG